MLHFHRETRKVDTQEEHYKLVETMYSYQPSKAISTNHEACMPPCMCSVAKTLLVGIEIWGKDGYISQFRLPTHSPDIAMKECTAYGGVTERSEIEDVYDNPQ